MSRVLKADRLHEGGITISFIRFLDDFSVKPITNYWRDVILSSRVEDKVYVVQTSVKLIQRCILLSTDPGDFGTGSNLRFWEHGCSRRTVGPSLDNDRHIPCCACASSRSDHGREISVLRARRFPWWPTQGSRS